MYMLQVIVVMNTPRKDDDFEQLDMGSVTHQKGQLKVVLSGKVQTGKSSLINSLTGTVVAKENLSPKDQSLEFNVYGTHVEVKDGKQQKTIDVLL